MTYSKRSLVTPIELMMFGRRTHFPTAFSYTFSLFMIEGEESRLEYEITGARSTLPSFPSCLEEIDAIFLSLTMRSIIPQQFINLELERYILKHGKILITIAPEEEKSISPHATVHQHHCSVSNQGLIRLLDRSSLTTIVEGPSCLYNDNMSSLNNESKSTLEGPQALFGDEICDTALGRQPGYLKGVDLWGYGICGH
ncbi:NBS-LRR type resistance protein [Cucumis melo var. makuwa]|uniref:NBS-LRR type resistance protein n=1 Tax=Cucumis melo var. makuwa TaxID=1194695 RepID=A0A5A7UJN2_CUCMM|nr:NBS-LRR type resistance protein [Cucumis melo var. makuwa]